MGNCWGSPVKVHSPSSNTKPSSIPQVPKCNEEVAAEDKGKLGISGSGDVAASGCIVTPNLKMFTYTELKSATRNFRPDSVVGEGGFGRVFKGWVHHDTYSPSKPGVGMQVAVKKSNPDSLQGLKEWQAEVKFLGKFSHPNLVKLLGYCWDDIQFLLVYEYMLKGSLESHLFKRNVEPLSWETRINIAIGAARGLAFLHTTEKQVIYRDFKAANILLDVDFNAKLSDFGLAKLGPMNGDSHVTTGVVGTYGYAAPEYMATGHLYVKSDVYGFGVVLLEILTGLRVLDTNRPSGEHNLIEWAMPCLFEKRRLKKIMDPRLGNNYPSKGAFLAAKIVVECLEADPKKRPSMEEVVANLEEIGSIKKSTIESTDNNLTSSKSADTFQNHARRQGYGGHNRSPFQQKYGGSSNYNGTEGRGRSPLQTSY